MRWGSRSYAWEQLVWEYHRGHLAEVMFLSVVLNLLLKGHSFISQNKASFHATFVPLQIILITRLAIFRLSSTCQVMPAVQNLGCTWKTPGSGIIYPWIGFTILLVWNKKSSAISLSILDTLDKNDYETRVSLYVSVIHSLAHWCCKTV